MPVINTTDNQRNQLSDNWSPYDPVHKRLRRHTSFQLKIKERRLNTLQLPTPRVSPDDVIRTNVEHRIDQQAVIDTNAK